MLWHVGSDTLVTVEGLQDEADTSTYISGATVSGQMYDEDGDAIGSAITFAYVAASDGNYRGTIPNGLALTVGERYTLKVTITSGSLVRVFRIKRLAGYERLD
jgi:hypothetical protein